MSGMADRALTSLDYLLNQADLALRAAFGRPMAARPSPATGVIDHLADGLDRRQAAAQMRVNHAGEVAAQGLYHGQTLSARSRSKSVV